MSESVLLSKRVQNLAIASKIKVSSFLSGNRKSLFLGNGTEFEDLRDYIQGDDVRFIDWRATAKRQNHLIVRDFNVERNANVLFLLDSSASMMLGKTGERIKSAVLAIGSLAHAVLQNKDLFGFGAFSTQINSYIPPKAGKPHEFLIYRRLLEIIPQGETKLGASLKQISTSLNKRSIIIVMSDLHDDLEEMYKGFKIAKGFKHDVQIIKISDKDEFVLPTNIGKIKFNNPQTGKPSVIDFTDPITSGNYYYEINKKKYEIESFIRKLRGLKVRVIETSTEDMIEKALISYFSSKQRGFQ